MTGNKHKLSVRISCVLCTIRAQFVYVLHAICAQMGSSGYPKRPSFPLWLLPGCRIFL